jgi:chromosomal replication initiator protein
MNGMQAWQAAVGQLQMDMQKATFETWVKDTHFLSYEDNSMVVGVPNAYARDWLESRLTSTVSRKLVGIMGKTTSVSFVVSKNKEDFIEKTREIIEEPVQVILTPRKINTSLNPRYTFENFVPGTNSRIALAAAQAVADNPAKNYNPLFLYGGVGLGKTHLLHAIGNKAASNGFEVLYVSSEEFTNDLITAIRSHKTPAFRDKYRNTDVLLIDDIQFIAGKESTQEEFFHTFNSLHGQNKHIVITSDRPPKAMNTLEERLRSRFEWGLTTDIQLPDLETRQAILQDKTMRSGKKVPDEIIELIAHKMQSNIRELEGALNRILAYADLRGMALDKNLVDMALIDLLPQPTKLSPIDIISIVASFFGITVDQIIEKNRARHVALPRQVAMYLLREETNISLPQIGRELGGRDHTTIMYGCDKVAGLLEQDPRLRRKVVDIRDQIYGQFQMAA